MTDKPDNPQAFPHGNPTDGGELGMTLRDYFAGQFTRSKMQLLPDNINEYQIRVIARVGYMVADVMLEERCSARRCLSLSNAITNASSTGTKASM